MGKSNEMFKPWAPVPDIENWYRNALNRDPDLVGLQFWNDLYKQSGAEAAWGAFCAAAAALGYPVTLSREEASKPVTGGNYSVVDEWFRNFNVTGNWLHYELMVSNGVPIPEVFKRFCRDYGIKGFDWLEASKLT